ncbi:cation:dicarboxylate symporter family transporter, partial [Aetokthonos hydrillicola]
MNETTTENTNRPFWQRIPLALQIVIALILAVVLGIALGAGHPNEANKAFIENLAIPSQLVLKALRALATPLIFVAVLHTLMTTHIPGRVGRRLGILLLTNTTVAILIGLFVANVLRPGTWRRFSAPGSTITAKQNLDPWGLFKDAIPEAILQPLVNNDVLQLIVVALSFGIVLRAIKSEQVAQGKTGYQAIEEVIGILFEAVIRI